MKTDGTTRLVADYAPEPPAMQPMDMFPRVNEVEVIDGVNGQVVGYTDVRVKLLLTNGGRTLKVLLTERIQEAS